MCVYKWGGEDYMADLQTHSFEPLFRYSDRLTFVHILKNQFVYDNLQIPCVQIIVNRCVFTNGEERTIWLMGVIHRPPISFASLTTKYKSQIQIHMQTQIQNTNTNKHKYNHNIQIQI